MKSEDVSGAMDRFPVHKTVRALCSFSLGSFSYS